MENLQEQLITALEFIRDDKNNALSRLSRTMIGAALVLAAESVVSDKLVEDNTEWQSIVLHGQPKEVGTYEVRYSWQNEYKTNFETRYYDGSHWTFTEYDDEWISFGNEDPEGEFYRKKK